MANFEVSSDQDHVDVKAWRVSLAGEFDLAGAVEFDQAVDQLLARGARLVTLDMEQVSFLDSSGLRALIRARTMLAAADGRLAVGVISAPAQRVLDVAGVLDEIRGAADTD